MMWHLILLLVSHCNGVQPFPVFTFNGTSPTSTQTPSYAYLVNDVDLPDKFILCTSVKQARFDDVGFYVISGKDSGEWLTTQLITSSKKTWLAIRWDEAFYKIGKLQNPMLDIWYRICLTIGMMTNEIEASVDGQLIGKVHVKNVTKGVSNKPDKLRIKIGLGRANEQFQGSMTNIRLLKEVNTSTSPCEQGQDDILSWSHSNWNLVGSQWAVIEEFEDQVCAPNDFYDLAIPSKMTIHESMDTCKQKLNNSIIPFELDKDLFFKYVDWHTKATGGGCTWIWTPLKKLDFEGLFLNMNDNTETKIQNWARGQPNGGRNENFVEIIVSQMALADGEAEEKDCSSCRISVVLLLQLDGRCEHSLIDQKYKILNAQFSIGFNGWKNMYNKDEKVWKMRHARNDDFLAISRASESSLLLGTHLWEVHNDSVMCTREGRNIYLANLTLHACSTENFACDNAFCIPMQKRCNGFEDCVDGSDEHDCGKLIIREGFKKEQAPVPKKGRNLGVNFSFSLLDIEPHEQTSTFTSKISFTRKWFDDRLMYKHLKLESEKEMNTLLPDEEDLIWYPFIIFYNIRSIEDMKQTEVPDVMEVIPNNNSAKLAVNNMHIFNGSENALSLKKVCQMDIVSKFSRTDLHPANLLYNKNISLDRYTLSSIRMCKSEIIEKNAIIVEVTLGRPIINNLLTVFVPTKLLVIISFTARLFAEEYIDMVIQVNVTVMLALATIFLGLSQSVPVTSYIKMVDIWMLFTMTVPFLEVVYHTSNEMSKRSEADVVRVIQSEEDEMSNNNMKVAVLRRIKRFVLPISSLLFTIIYWIVGLIASYYSGVTKDSNMYDCLMIDLN